MKNISDLKIKTFEGLSIKNYSRFPSREWGDEGGMQADVYLNGNYTGKIYNAGDGGDAFFYKGDKCDIEALKTACFKFLKRVDKSYFKYSFSPKKASDLRDDDICCAVDLIACYYTGKARVL